MGNVASYIAIEYCTVLVMGAYIIPKVVSL